MSTTTEDMTEEVQPAPTARRRNRWARIAAVSALALALTVGAAFAWNSHVQSEYDKRDDAIRLLRLETDKDKKSTARKHERALASLTATHEVTLKEAVAAEKRRGTRALRRAVRKQKSRARREAAAARAAGYSSGSAAGYASGHADGEDLGLEKGSDSLDCSDDIDVYWLPPCY